MGQMFKQSASLADFFHRLDEMHSAFTVVDLSQPGQPLVFVNRRFRKMTGYSDAVLGQNCRFLQDGMNNVRARQELRAALAERRQTQVILQNCSAGGEAFGNLLFVGMVGERNSQKDYAIGCQFRLSGDQLFDGGYVVPKNLAAFDLPGQHQGLKLVIERQRLLSETAMQIIGSWWLEG